MKQVIAIQLIITLIISLVLWIIVGENAGISYFLPSFAVVLPGLLLVFLSLWVRNDQVIFWLGAFVNKFISAILLVGSIKYLKDPNWAAFLIGIIVTVHLPVVVMSFGHKYLKQDIKH